ncbi:MAG: hypothetical protein M9887_08185 [Chitinophagales bacterium]|nr:hypothetical protein [Chitinophagales bacterium]
MKKCFYTIFLLFILISNSLSKVNQDILLTHKEILINVNDDNQGIQLTISRDSILQFRMPPYLSVEAQIYEISIEDSLQKTVYFSKFDDGYIQAEVGHYECTTTNNLELHYHNLKTNDYRYLQSCAQWTPDERLHDIWIMEKIDDKKLRKDDYPNGLPRLEFLLNKQKLYGFDGINEIEGTFEFQGSQLIILSIDSLTFKKTTTATQNMLHTPFNYEIKNNHLYLQGNYKSFTFRKVD